MTDFCKAKLVQYDLYGEDDEGEPFEHYEIEIEDLRGEHDGKVEFYVYEGKRTVESTLLGLVDFEDIVKTFRVAEYALFVEEDSKSDFPAVELEDGYVMLTE